MQTAFEKLSEAELAAIGELLTDPNKGACAKVFALSEQARFERNRRTGKPRSQGLSSGELFKRMLADETERKLHELAAVEGKGAKLHELDAPGFKAALYASRGANEFFGDEAAAAARAGNADFFKAAADGIKVANQARNGENARDIEHLTAALVILKKHASGSEGFPKITKQDLQGQIGKLLGRAGIAAYSDRDSWRKLWERPELAPFLTQARSNGRRAGYCGNGREVED